MSCPCPCMGCKRAYEQGRIDMKEELEAQQ